MKIERRKIINIKKETFFYISCLFFTFKILKAEPLLSSKPCIIINNATCFISIGETNNSDKLIWLSPGTKLSNKVSLSSLDGKILIGKNEIKFEEEGGVVTLIIGNKRIILTEDVLTELNECKHLILMVTTKEDNLINPRLNFLLIPDTKKNELDFNIEDASHRE